ncbi:MAG: Hemerythrin cation binding domain protein [Bacteroidetes bacterium]|nr:Hemerythrin cation binding domain protein [Bacteroidota bacterium]
MGKTNNSSSGAINRSHFIKSGIIFSAVAIGGLNLLSSCNDKDEDKEVSPPEDLMQEHGLLNRILLIYDACRMHLINKEPFAIDGLGEAAGIIKAFVEDYHEKQEENYLFPRFEKVGKLTDLVQVLRTQHDKGRNITAQLIELTKTSNRNESDDQKLITLLGTFNIMYRPHEAREDTMLFPAFRKIVSRHEYDSLGEEFEKNEQKHFGEGGFEKMVDKVAAIEKRLGIYDLSQFTPTG